MHKLGSWHYHVFSCACWDILWRHAQHGLPILARDISVFREVAGEHAYYFKNDSSDIVLSNAFKGWLSLYKVGKQTSSSKMPWLTWRESTEKLLDCLDIKVRG